MTPKIFPCQLLYQKLCRQLIKNSSFHFVAETIFKIILSQYSKDTFSFSCSFKQSKSIRHRICNYRPSILEYDNNSILNNDNINTSNDSNISCNCHLYSEFSVYR